MIHIYSYLTPCDQRFIIIIFFYFSQFATLMVLVFVLELAGGISGYVLRSHATTIVADNMKESMAQYNSSKDIALLWDEVQKDVILVDNSST